MPPHIPRIAGLVAWPVLAGGITASCIASGTSPFLLGVHHPATGGIAPAFSWGIPAAIQIPLTWITAGLAHQNLTHLVGNLLVYVIALLAIARAGWSTRQAALATLAALPVVGAATWLTTPPDQVHIGASGATHALVLATALIAGPVLFRDLCRLGLTPPADNPWPQIRAAIAQMGTFFGLLVFATLAVVGVGYQMGWCTAPWFITLARPWMAGQLDPSHASLVVHGWGLVIGLVASAMIGSTRRHDAATILRECWWLLRQPIPRRRPATS